MNCSICNLIKSMSKITTIVLFLIIGLFSETVAQECVSDPTILVKWDFTNAQECNGIVTNKFKHWKPNVPLMTGGNQYCPQINDGSGQAMIYEKGFGNTNDFKEAMCVAGFWKNGGNKYFTAPGYDENSPTYNPDNFAGNIWINYNFLPGQAGSLNTFQYELMTSGWRESQPPTFEKWGVSVYRNGVRIYEETFPITAANMNNPDNPLVVNFPNTANFKTDGSTEVLWEIAFALVDRNAKKRTGIDNLCLLGTAGPSVANVEPTPATCESGGVDGKLEVMGFSLGEKYDFNEGSSYTGTATFSSATAIPADGIIADDLPLETEAKDYTIRIFREDCYIDAVVVMPPVFCPYTCDFPTATITPNPATCANEVVQNDATIVLTNIVDMDRVGISSGQTYTGPAYAGAVDLGGATTFTFDNTDGITSGTCTEYFTIRGFNGAEDEELCIVDRVVAISPVSCDGCQIICAELVNTDSEETDDSNDLGFGEACKTDQKVDIQLTKDVNVNNGSNCEANGSGTSFVFTVTAENIGDLDATDVTVLDVFPDEMVIESITSSSGTILEGYSTISWVLPTLAINGSETMTVTASFVLPGTYDNCVEVANVLPDSDPDDSNDNDCASVTVTGVNLPTLEKAFSPEFARPNIPVRLILKIFNNEVSPIALTEDLVDILPDSPGQMVIANAPNLSSAIPGIVAIAGASQIVVPSGTVLQSGLNLIQVDVVGPTTGDYVNLIAAGDLKTTSCSNVIPARAEVNMSDENVIGPMLTKSFSNDMLALGQKSTLTLTIENRNPESITLVSDFVDEMPEGLMVTGTPTSTCGGSSTFGEVDRVGLLAGTVISGNSECVIEVEVEAISAGSHCNRIPFNAVIVEVDLAGGSVMTANEDVAEACVEITNDPIFDLALRKTLSANQSSEVGVGTVVSYDITVFNQGTEEAIDVQITDYVSTDMTLVDDNVWEMSGGNAVLETAIPSILPGASITIPIQLTINESFEGESITNIAEISSVGNTTLDKDSTPDNMRENDKGGLVMSASDDVIFGDATMPGGAPLDENGLTDEDDADPAIVFIVLTCSMDVTATPGACINDDGNYYSLSGTVTFEEPPTTGTIMISVDGTVVETLDEYTSPQTFTIDGLASDGAMHTVTAVFSDDEACTASFDYTAPDECFMPEVSEPCTSGSMGGSVFVDANADGQNNDGTPSTDLSGIEVFIFGCDEDGTSVLIETVVTDANGDYSFTDPSIVDGEDYRIEFDNLPEGFSSSSTGVDNGTEVQYVDMVNCDISLGILNSETCIDPQVAVVCFTRNNDQDSESNIIFIDNDSGRDFVSNSSTDNGLEWGTPQGANAANYPLSFLEVSNKGEVNTTLGLDWDNSNRQLLSGAFMRAFAPMGSNSIGNNFAEATIYSIPFDGTTPQNPTVWLDLETIYGDGFAGVYLPDNNFSTANFGRTGNNPDKIGYTGLGSIRISKDHSEVYVVNLQSQEVLVIPMNSDGSAVADMSLIKRFPLPSTECGGTWPDGRPLKTVLGLGVHPQSGMVYASLTCTGPTVDDVTGYVYSFDPSDDSPSSTDFNLELTIPLNISRPATHANTSTQFWSLINHEWESVTANNEFYNNDGAGTNLQHTQPWLGEIEFTEDSAGSIGMTVVERNRYSDLINMSFYVAGGAMFKACGSEGSWSLESNGVCGALTSSVNYSFTNASSAGSNTSDHNRFYQYVGREGTMMTGTIGSIPGTGEVFGPATDNVFNRATSGIAWLDPMTGLRTRDTRIFGNFTVPATGITNFTKSNNWGGITAICGELPIQVGNYAWIDTNGDGVQDPCEEPLPGLTVKLYTKPETGNAVLVATTTTSATGEYYFTNSSTSGETWESGFTEVEAGDYFIAFCGDSYDPSTGLVVLGEENFVLTTPDSGMGSNFDLNDSDVSEVTVTGVGDLPAICISIDETDYSFDAGFVSKPVVEIVDVDISCGPESEGGALFLTVEGGMEPFTYEWSEAAYDGMTEILNVPVGMYTVTVTDGTGCEVIVDAEITIETCEPNPCTGDNLGGTVFIDLDADGTNDGSAGNEEGPEGILVQIFECDINGESVLIDEAYTDVNGDYFFSNPSIMDGVDYRIEFSNIPDGYTSSVEGTDNGTETQFVDVISCEVDYGILNPEGCFDLSDGDPSSNDIRVLTTCFVNGDITENDPNELSDVLLALDYDYGGVNGNQYLASKAEMGSIWGVSYNQAEDVVYASSILKRHTGIGPDGPGAIYQHDFATGTNSTFVDLVALGIDVGTMPSRDLGEPNQPSYDSGAFSLIGKMSLGDIDISNKDQLLFVMNLHDKKIYEIDIETKTVSNSYDTPDPGCSLGTWRPFAVKFNKGQLYIGGVCDGSTGGTNSNLTGYVYRLDGSTFTEVLSIPLNYTKGAANLGGTILQWFPWEDDFNQMGNASPTTKVHPQPILSDIEFDETGAMIIGFIDRSGFQLGYQNYDDSGTNTALWNNIATGDILRAAASTDGTFVLENNGSSDGITTSGANNNEGPGGGEFFAGDLFQNFVDNPHREIVMGGLAVLNGSGHVVASAFDPRDGTNAEFNSGGLIHLSTTTGLKLNNFSKRIYSAAVSNQGAFGKSAGIGDVEILCDPAPIQLGNYVWVDANGDGIQDPCEAPVEGLTVKLYTKPESGEAVLAATTTTDTDGEYYFTNNTTTGETWETGFTEVESGADYYVVFCGDSYNDETEVITANGTLFSLTSENTGMGDNPDFNDSDATEITVTGIGDLPAICVTADSINHTLDVGLLPKPDVALIQVLDPDYDVTGLSFGDSVKFKMVVTNQSLGSIDSVQITNYIPDGYTFDSTMPGNEEWTANADGNPVTYLTNGMSSLEKDSTCIYLILEPSDDPTEWINVAEISAGYSNGEEIEDCDSPLNDNPDDNGGSEINTDADDYIDGDGTSTGPDGVADTDQDNVDPATVPICDLALINQIAESPTTLSVGDTIKFEVIVENQGTVPATNIDIKYTIPNGFDYINVNDDLDPVWDENSDCATATIDETLGIGEKDTLCIYLTIDNVATEDVTEESWTTFAEISAFEDPEEPGEDKSDVDSTPDSDPTNDPGGNPDDDTDNETGGDGSGDPDDETEDSDPDLDEDDHDPAIIYICDAATIIYTDDEGPFQYFDTVKFNVVVFNQGNGDITNVELNDVLGQGLVFVDSPLNTAEEWTGDDDLVSTTMTTILEPGESDTICLELQLVDMLPFDEDAYLQIVEIESFEDPENPGDPKEDIDSTPDDDPENDSGGNPDDNTDDETDGEGGDPNDPDDTDPIQDEDDHDPVMIGVFDLALNKIIREDKPYAPGEKVLFDITIFNQGNVDAERVEVMDFLNTGFTFSTTNNPGWTMYGDNLKYVSNQTLEAGDSTTIVLELTVVIPDMPTGLSDWWNYAEISDADDNSDPNDTPPVDADSTPDETKENDNPVEPQDAEDNMISENGLEGEDEDDHDPEMVLVGYDVALAKTVSPEGPYSYGDTLTYNITLTNQGGLTMSNIAVYDSLPCGLLFLEGENPGWTLSGAIATTTYAPQLGSSESTTLKLKVAVMI